MIHNNPIGDAGAMVLGEFLKTNRTLRELILIGNNVGVGARVLVEALKGNTTLKILRLEWQMIPGFAIDEFLDVLYDPLSSTVITDITQRIGLEVAQILEPMIRQNTTLETLDLRGNYPELTLEQSQRFGTIQTWRSLNYAHPETFTYLNPNAYWRERLY
jgi:hypothetical protein